MISRAILGAVFLSALALAGCRVATTGAATDPARSPEPIAIPETVAGVWAARSPGWYEQIDPFRMIGNIYFVGTKGLGIYFIPTPEGHIIIDGGMAGQAQSIAEHIETLGFDVSDVRILLNTHAHFDHSGGLAELKVITGAELVASEGDVSALEGGFYLGSETDAMRYAPKVAVDRTIADGEVLTLGDVRLTAHLTPGHSRGCTSWTLEATEDETVYDVLIFCSATVAGNQLIGPPQYQGIVEDYRNTFDKTREWRPDVFLANHNGWFHMHEKREQLMAGHRLAFVDQIGFPTMMRRLEDDFEEKLAMQTAAIPVQ